MTSDQKKPDNLQTCITGAPGMGKGFYQKPIVSADLLQPAKIPDVAYLRPSTDPYRIPLGVGADGEFLWDVHRTANALITGVAGSGKSVLTQDIIFHCSQHWDTWAIVGIDIKGADLRDYGVLPGVEQIATSVADAHRALTDVYNQIDERYARLHEEGLLRIEDLTDAPPRILLVVEETMRLMTPSGVKTDEGQAEDALKHEIATLLRKIVRLGKGAGVNVVLSTQRPDASLLDTETKRHLPLRIVVGSVSQMQALMTLGQGELGREFTMPRGRAYVQEYGTGQEIQVYYAPEKWMHKFTLGHQDWIEHWAKTGQDLDMFRAQPLPR